MPILAEDMKTQGRKDGNKRMTMFRGLKRLKNTGKRKSFATVVVDELHDKRRIQEDECWEEFEDYMISGTLRKVGRTPWPPKFGKGTKATPPRR